MKKLWLVAVLILLAGAALAQKAQVGDDYELKAKTFDWDLENNVLVASVQAKLTTNDGSLTADKISAAVAGDANAKQLKTATAEGNVRMLMTLQSGRSVNATGAKAIYDNVAKELKMSGNVVVVIRDKKLAGPARVSGETATIKLLDSGATALSAAGKAALIATDQELRAESIEVEIEKNSTEPDMVKAQGSVSAKMSREGKPLMDATCNRAELMPSRNKVQLFGDVVVNYMRAEDREPAQMTGDAGTIYLSPAPRRITRIQMTGEGKQTVLQVHPKSKPKEK